MDFLITKSALLSTIDTIISTGIYPEKIEKIRKDDFGNEVFSIDALKEHVESLPDQIDFEQLLPEHKLDSDDYYFWADKVFIISLLAKELLDAYEKDVDDLGENIDLKGHKTFKSHVKVKGDLTVKDDAFIIVYGNLEIDNRLIVEHGTLIVFGDLIITNEYKEITDLSEVFVCGSMFSTNYIVSSSNLFIGKKVYCDILYLSFNNGKCLILDGCRTQIFVEIDHPESRIWGDVEADFIEVHEMSGITSHPEEENIEVLKDILKHHLADKAIEKYKTDTEDFLNLLIELIDNNESIFG